MKPLTDAGQRLVTRHMPLARTLARPFRMARPWLYDELTSAADLALVESAALYETSSRVKFSAFARPRILGAIKDELARYSTPDMHQDTFPRDALEGADRRGFGPNDRPEPVGAALQALEETEHLIGGFPERFRPLVRLLFVDGLSLKLAARQLGITESGATKRLKAAIAAWHVPQPPAAPTPARGDAA
jgi:RNA polymerase sigma factor (sigma-70 family)